MVFRLDDNHLALVGCLINLVAIGNTLDEVLVFQAATHLADDNSVEWVPLTNHVTLLEHVAWLEEHLRTIDDIGAGEHHVGVRIHDSHLGHTTNHDVVTVLIGNGAKLVNLETTIILRCHVAHCGDVTCHTTHVERTQCKLSTRLTNRLSGNHAHCLSLLNQAMVSKVATVALGTNTMLRLASEDRTDLHTLDRRIVDAVGCSVVDFFTCFNDNLAGSWVYHIVNRYTSHNALTQGGYHVIVILNLAADESTQGTTVFLGDNNVVSHIHKTTGQVTSVGGLQSGIGKTLAGTVSRDKVLKHRQTFLEVGKNWVLDNLVTTFNTTLLWLSHQTTHTRKLTNLVTRATGT